MSPRARRGLVIAGLIVAPMGIHIAMATQRGMIWARLLVIAEAVLLAWIGLSAASSVAASAWPVARLVLVVTATLWRYTGGRASSHRRRFRMRSPTCPCWGIFASVH